MTPYRCKVSGRLVTLLLKDGKYHWSIIYKKQRKLSESHETLAGAMQSAIGFIAEIKRK